MRVSVLMAFHNRKDFTISCLQKLYSAKPSNWSLDLYITDDGSTDGTAEELIQTYSGIKLIQGDGNWYWAHSMHRAELAIDKPSDAILWLNDDVELFTFGLERIYSTHLIFPDSIVVGQLRQKSSMEISYGGFSKYDHHPFHFRRDFAIDVPIKTDTFNGNVVFIPRSVGNRIGSIDGAFSHAYADLDYGLRAKAANIQSVICPGFIGVCENAAVKLVARSFKEVLIDLSKPKAGTLKSRIRFLRRHGDWTWPIYLVAPIVFGAKVSIQRSFARLTKNPNSCAI